MSASSPENNDLDINARTVQMFRFLYDIATADRSWEGSYYQGHTQVPLQTPNAADHILAWPVTNVWGVRTLQIEATAKNTVGSHVSVRYDSNPPNDPDWAVGTELNLYGRGNHPPDAQINTNEPAEHTTDILPPVDTPRLPEVMGRMEWVLLQVLGRYGITDFISRTF